MSVSPETYKTSWDVHAWVGVITGLFLTVIFGTGAVVVFHDDIETWQDPHAQARTPAENYERWTELAADGFEGKPPRQFTLWMPAGERGYPKVGYFSAETGRYLEEWIVADRGELVPKREKLGTLLYHVHTLYDIRFTTLYHFAGVFALVMLLVLVTGIVIQWDNLVEQFHQFRPGADPFVKWNDLHKVVGVSTLPFQLFYAYSAAVIVLAPFFVDAVTGPVFDGDAAAAKRATYGRLERPSGGDEEAETDRTVSVHEMVSTARQKVPGLEVGKIIFRNWERSNALVDVEGSVEGDRFSHAIVRLDPGDGGVVGASAPEDYSWGADLRNWLAEVHSVHFGGFGVQLLFALLSLACAASMLAGMVVWFARRRRQRDALVDRLLEKLTAGVGTGTIVAIATLFVGSRLLPMEMQHRLFAEEMVHYLTFFGCVVAAFAVSDVKWFWRMQLGLAGLLFGAAPLLAARHSTAGLASLWTADGSAIPSVIGVDVGLTVAGCALVAVSLALPTPTTVDEREER